MTMNINLTPHLEDIIRKRWIPVVMLLPARLCAKRCALWNSKTTPER